MFDLMPFAHGQFDRAQFNRQQCDLLSLFNDFEKNLFSFPESFAGFRADIVDKGDKYVLEAELPGYTKEDIHIDVDGDRLTISAQHQEDKEDKKDNFIRRERSYGSFARSFDISNVKADAITAEYKNGVLALNLPKNENAAEKNRHIDIQ